MPRKSPDKYLLDMMLAGQKIRRFLSGYDKQRFVADEKTISAVERQFEILGEAARQVDEATRQKFPEIDFRKIVGMRNIIAHDYENIRVNTMWSTAQKHVPEAKALNVTTCDGEGCDTQEFLTQKMYCPATTYVSVMA